MSSKNKDLQGAVKVLDEKSHRGLRSAAVASGGESDEGIAGRAPRNGGGFIVRAQRPCGVQVGPGERGPSSVKVSGSMHSRLAAPSTPQAWYTT